MHLECAPDVRAAASLCQIAGGLGACALVCALDADGRCSPAALVYETLLAQACAWQAGLSQCGFPCYLREVGDPPPAAPPPPAPPPSPPPPPAPSPPPPAPPDPPAPAGPPPPPGCAERGAPALLRDYYAHVCPEQHACHACVEDYQFCAWGEVTDVDDC
jgi:hypothetical protein